MRCAGEDEGNLFFKDSSKVGINDDILIRLLSFPNVMMTSHQGFLTQEALENIAKTTANNMFEFLSGKTMNHVI